MRTIRECRIHGETEHGAQNRCLLCKKGHSRAFRASRGAPAGATGAEIASKFGISKAQTSRVLRGARWGHVK